MLIYISGNMVASQVLNSPSDTYMRHKTNHHWFRWWLVAWTVLSRYLNQCTGILLVGPFRTNFKEFFIEIQAFSLTTMHLKISSTKWHPFFPTSMCRSYLYDPMWFIYTAWSFGTWFTSSGAVNRMIFQVVTAVIWFSHNTPEVYQWVRG